MSDLANPAERVIDVTEIAPEHRHTILFQLIDHLPAGHALQLVVDHDPRRLRLQVEARHGARYAWTYLAQGPDVWRVRLQRAA
jgi:uncharacterized protein (DUF2249 family)